MKRRLWIAVLGAVLAALLFPAFGCGGGGTANNWDEMLWDQGQWQ